MTKLLLALALGIVPRPVHQPDVATMYSQLATQKSFEYAACEQNIVLTLSQMTGVELYVAHDGDTHASTISTRQENVGPIKDLPCGNWLIYTRLLADFEACEHQRQYWMAVSWLVWPEVTAEQRDDWEGVLGRLLGE